MHKKCTMRPVHLACAPCMQKVRAQLSFPASEMGNAPTVSPNPSRNSPINTSLPHSEFLVQNWSSSR